MKSPIAGGFLLGEKMNNQTKTEVNKPKLQKLHDVTRVAQFQNKDIINGLFEVANEFKNSSDHPESLHGKVVATLFYEPSTRTRLSFEAATERLHGKIISTENAGQFSSAAKGETLEDTIKTICGYADAIVLRHPEIGAAERAVEVASVPIINAGDGAGEHPTQALLDLFTIREEKPEIDGLKIGLVGDLLNGRTIHSLVQLLSMYDVELFFIAPEQLQLPEKYKARLREIGIKYTDCDSWDNTIEKLDVIYVTRVQKERFESEEDYIKIKDSFILDTTIMRQAKQDSIVMHPLPRVNEIALEVDADPRAKYFEQAHNGLYVRMALLQMLLVP